MKDTALRPLAEWIDHPVVMGDDVGRAYRLALLLNHADGLGGVTLRTQTVDGVPHTSAAWMAEFALALADHRKACARCHKEMAREAARRAARKAKAQRKAKPRRKPNAEPVPEPTARAPFAGSLAREIAAACEQMRAVRDRYLDGEPIEEPRLPLRPHLAGWNARRNLPPEATS